ncbi:lipopolysaccharide assembly protein LapA domain-containing protein [Idiomarina seosinensis]|uniref:DUF1049 domain-containing protein n=1 Tax=Idiomarina seosinensis TaxID=281739 RepID=A0A432ZI74_9GAMM|nr:lipopolysaccharide assembly protein LapA domain-containing protein [Idiomarina seosinensis]RUO77629.1 DUF1049 domain-containing protein [Idiomarina seosinensis]
MLKKLLFIIPVLLIFFIALAFGAQNATLVTVNFLILESELSVAAVAGIFLGLGFIIALAFYILSLLKWKLRYRRLLKKFHASRSASNTIEHHQDQR